MAKKAKRTSPRRKSTTSKPRVRRAARPTPIPEYLHAVTPSLVFRDTVAAIRYYVKAFGARELSRMMAPDGKAVWHAELRIGDSVLFMNDESPMNPVKAPGPERPATAGLHLYVKDCDAAIARAVDAGAKVSMPAADMFWGDRMGSVVDPFGITWGIATRRARLTPKQLRAAAEDFVRRSEPVAYPHEPGGEEYGPGEA